MRPVLLLIATLAAIGAQLAPDSAVAQPTSANSGPVPKAVFIVGPTNGLTDSNLADAEKMAVQAEAAGMEVRRVFFPNATWDNVLANIQDASLVVYMGHGYGWPSPYTRTLTESRQNGMGLNTFAGSSKSQYTYYGATRIRESIRLAPNAVVFLNHLCYSAGNAEPGMAIPGEDLARQRVDNMASGWLAVGARAVFAYGWWQKLNYPQALMTTDRTMDELFMTPATGASAGSPAGFVGWQNRRFDSVRTPGATNHLDPHRRAGYYRAVSGDLNMTAAEFRAGAMGTLGSSPTPDAATPPEITALSADGSGAAASTSLAAQADVSFHPNGDGVDDELVVTHTVTRAATLDVTITNAAGNVVRRFSGISPRGTSTSRWNGRNDAGGYVPDGVYTLTYVPRDSAGVRGSPVAINAAVMTAIKVGKPSSVAFFSSDGDGLNKTVKLPLTLNQSAVVTWHIVDASGAIVRTVRDEATVSAGLAPFVWNGKRDDGSWAPEGWYRSVVSARTSLGTYTHERSVYAGAFRVTPSATTPAPGQKVTLTIVSTEALSGTPRVTVTQPEAAPTQYATTKLGTRKFRVTITLAPGPSGRVEFVVSGTDSRGGRQQTVLALPLG